MTLLELKNKIDKYLNSYPEDANLKVGAFDSEYCEWYDFAYLTKVKVSSMTRRPSYIPEDSFSAISIN